MPTRFLPAPDHPKLSDEAAGLSPARLEIEAEQALFVLDEALGEEGLPPLSALPEGHARAVLAVVNQINYQVAIGSDGTAKGSENVGSQATVYARNPKSGQMPSTDPFAIVIARSAVRELASEPGSPTAPSTPRLPRYVSGSTRTVVSW